MASSEDSERVRELLAALDDSVTEVHMRSGYSSTGLREFEVTLKRQPKGPAPTTQVFGQQQPNDDLAGFGAFMPPVPRID